LHEILTALESDDFFDIEKTLSMPERKAFASFIKRIESESLSELVREWIPWWLESGGTLNLDLYEISGVSEEDAATNLNNFNEFVGQ
jgi:hypothetical protein